MSEQTLGITLKNPAALAAGGDWLLLEQKPWEDKSGDAFAEWLYESGQAPEEPASIFGLYDQFRSGCAADGSFTTQVYVKTSRPDLEYNLVADNGELSERIVETQTIARTYRLGELSRTVADFEGRIDTLHSYEWLLCYELDPSGSYVPVAHPPVVSLQNGKPVWDTPVLGSLRLRFTAEVDYYDLTVYPIADGSDNAEDILQCVVMALWAGEPQLLEIESPEKVGNCSRTELLNVISGDGDGDGDGDGEDQLSCYKLIIKVDACQLEELSRERVSMECPE